MTTFTAEQADVLGDIITDWTWTWASDHPRSGLDAWQRDLITVIDSYTDLTEPETTHLARQITGWARVWRQAADDGYADLDFGMEWRHSLQRYLAVSTDARYAWMAQPMETKLQSVHIATAEELRP